MPKRSLAVAITLTLGVLATACSSSDDGADTVHGIAVLSMDQKGRTVQVFDPNSGEVVLTKHFSIGENQQTLASCGGPVGISAFSPDYKQLAIRQSYGSGQHVGLLEGTDDSKKVAKFTDLSGDVEGKGKPVTQSTGAFGPDGKLYAIEQNDGGQVVKVINPSSGESENLNTKPTWTELDESGNQVTVDATADRAKPYFLPHGTEMEVDPAGHKVYTTDGKWGFEMPDDAHVTRGDLQKPTGKRYTVPMPKQADGAVDSVVPVVVQNEDSGVFVSYGGGALYRGKFLREELQLAKLNIPIKGFVNATGSPDSKSFAWIDKPDNGPATLSVAGVKGLKLKQLAKLTGQRICMLGWQ